MERMCLGETVDGYRVWLATRKLRPRAIATYLRDLTRYFGYLGDAATVADVTQETIEAYQASRAHLSGATLGKDLTIIRSYARWCVRKRFLSADPTLDIDWPSRDEVPPRALSSDELSLLERALAAPLAALPAARRSSRARDRRAVLIMLYGGLRISEVAALLWKDVDLDRGTIMVRDAKGGKFRLVPIHERLDAALREVPPEDRCGAVYGRRGDGKACSYKSLPHIFGPRWLASCGLHISAHELRHTFATQLLWAGANLMEIQRLLGHASLATTEKYLSLEIEQKRKAITRLPHRFGPA